MRCNCGYYYLTEDEIKKYIEEHKEEPVGLGLEPFYVLGSPMVLKRDGFYVEHTVEVCPVCGVVMVKL